MVTSHSFGGSTPRWRPFFGGWFGNACGSGSVECECGVCVEFYGVERGR